MAFDEPSSKIVASSPTVESGVMGVSLAPQRPTAKIMGR